MKLLVAALLVLTTSLASAQTLKWTFAADGAVAWSTDGRGALAVVHQTGGLALGAVTWVDNSGQPLFTNIIADLGANIAGSSVRIVRFDRTELAVQVEASYEHAPGTNFVRRFRSSGAFSDTVLPIGEQMDAQSATLVDGQGFFTRAPGTGGAGQIFRRYSN